MPPEAFDTVLSMHPTAHTTRYQRAQALDRLGRHDDAIRELEAVAKVVPGEAPTAMLAIVHAHAGRIGHARELLAHVSALFLRAQVFAALGDRERMFDMLENALRTDVGGLQNLISSPAFDPYERDPHFLDFAARAGFPLPLRPRRLHGDSAEARGLGATSQLR